MPCFHYTNVTINDLFVIQFRSQELNLAPYRNEKHFCCVLTLINIMLNFLGRRYNYAAIVLKNKEVIHKLIRIQTVSTVFYPSHTDISVNIT